MTVSHRWERARARKGVKARSSTGSMLWRKEQEMGSGGSGAEVRQKGSSHAKVRAGGQRQCGRREVAGAEVQAVCGSADPSGQMVHARGSGGRCVQDPRCVAGSSSVVVRGRQRGAGKKVQRVRKSEKAALEEKTGGGGGSAKEEGGGVSLQPQ